jgi:hypothetical protein
VAVVVLDASSTRLRERACSEQFTGGASTALSSFADPNNSFSVWAAEKQGENSNQQFTASGR